MSKGDHNEDVEDVEMVSIPRHVLEHLLKGQQLVAEAVTHIKTTAKEIMLTQRDEVEGLVEAWGPGNSENLFIACLNDVDKYLFEIDEKPITDYAEYLSESLIQCVSNDWDHEHIMGYRGKTEAKTTSHARKRNLQIVALLSNMARLRNHRCAPPLIMMKSYRFYWHGAQQNLLATDVATRNLFSPDWYEDITHKLQFYRAPVLFNVCLRYCVFATDNLEFYPLIKFQATNADGSKKKQEVLHTANTIQYPLPVELTRDEVEDKPHWPFLREWNPQDAIIPDEKLKEVLSRFWMQALLFSHGDDLSYMRKPHESFDKKQNFGEHGKKNPKHVLPILINVGTHSTADCQKIIDHIRTVQGKEVKKLVAGDMQTFKNLWMIKMRDPENNNDWVPIAGEWHLMAHLLDGIVRKNWRQIYEPVMLRFDIKGLQYKCVMKQTSVRLRWTMVIANAGFKWLRRIFDEETLSKPLELLERVKENIPVYNLITFIFYFVNPLWACRFATQTSNSSMMNFVWKYALLIFNVTNKVQYRSGCMQNSCVHMDSESNLRRIIRHCRFVSATGKPCSGTSQDYDVEAVRVSYMKMFILRRPPVLQWVCYVSPS